MLLSKIEIEIYELRVLESQSEGAIGGRKFKLASRNHFFKRQLDPKRNRKFDILDETALIVRNKIDPRFGGKNRSPLYYSAGYW